MSNAGLLTAIAVILSLYPGLCWVLERTRGRLVSRILDRDRDVEQARVTEERKGDRALAEVDAEFAAEIGAHRYRVPSTQEWEDVWDLRALRDMGAQSNPRTDAFLDEFGSQWEDTSPRRESIAAAASASHSAGP